MAINYYTFNEAPSQEELEKRIKEFAATMKDHVSGMAASLPFTVAECSAAEASVTLEYTIPEGALNRNRYVHGGVISWILDETMGYTAVTYAGEPYSATIDMSVSFIRGMQDTGKVKCRAEVQGINRNLVRMSAVLKKGETLVASAIGTYARFPKDNR